MAAILLLLPSFPSPTPTLRSQEQTNNLRCLTTAPTVSTTPFSSSDSDGFHRVARVMHGSASWVHLLVFFLFSCFFSSFLSLHPFIWYCELTPRFAVLSWKWHLFEPPLYVLSFISQAHYLDKVVKGTAFLLPSILPSSLPSFCDSSRH